MSEWSDRVPELYHLLNSKPHDRLVLGLLADWADENGYEGGHCWRWLYREGREPWDRSGWWWFNESPSEGSPNAPKPSTLWPPRTAVLPAQVYKAIWWSFSVRNNGARESKGDYGLCYDSRASALEAAVRALLYAEV